MRAAALVGICAMALGCTSGVHAAATLTGLVVQDRMNGPAVERVPISGRGVTPTSSGSNGVFVLRFPQSEPGDEVSIVAGDKAWAVVNDEVLSLRLPNAGGASKWHLTIVVAKPSERVQRRYELYGLVFREAAEQQFRKQLDELRQQLHLTEQERARERERLERALQTALALSQDSAKRISEAKPEEAGSLYKQALALFSQGKVEQALLALPDEQLTQEGNALREKEAQLVKAWVLKAQMQLTMLDFKAASKTLETVTRKAPGSFDAWFGYAIFNDMRNDFQAARTGYERALQLVPDASNVRYFAMARNNLGVLSRNEHRYAEARLHYEEALKLFREQSLTNPVYLRDVASTYHNLGSLSRDENQNAEARQQYEEALKIFRSLAANSPGTFANEIARIDTSLKELPP